MAFTDPDGNGLGPFRRGSRDQSLIGAFNAGRGTENWLTDDVEARSH
jgi:hypothetical protein